MAKKKTPTASKTKKATAKATSRKSAASKKASPKRKPTAKSIDGILGSFEKERVAQNTHLVSTRKKIEQLTKKVADLKQELESLKKEAVETEIAIETLDSRRDKEVGALLSSLGVDLGKAASAAKPKPVVDLGTPLFDEQAPKGKDSSDTAKKK